MFRARPVGTGLGTKFGRKPAKTQNQNCNLYCLFWTKARKGVRLDAVELVEHVVRDAQQWGQGCRCVLLALICVIGVVWDLRAAAALTLTLAL